jgi:hypothetical protein
MPEGDGIQVETIRGKISYEGFAVVLREETNPGSWTLVIDRAPYHYIDPGDVAAGATYFRDVLCAPEGCNADLQGIRMTPGFKNFIQIVHVNSIG